MARSGIHPVRTLFPHAVVATFGVVVAPSLVTFAMVMAGLPDPEVLLATLVGMALSSAAATVGGALWVKRPESIDVSFGELMLWRWHRRSRAEEKIHHGARLLDGGTNDVRALPDDERLALLRELTSALEVKDPYTSGHSKRVERHAYRTAIAMGLSGPATEELRLAAALHDVGKIKIPDRILRKPGSLNDREVAILREHVDVGAALASPAASTSVVAGIRHHHERWDGRGYPARLSGESIPLFARIISVVDAYDAITSARPYKAGTGRRDAVQVLEKGAGNQFDPAVVRAFVSTLPSTLPAVGLLMFLLAWPAKAARRTSAWAKGAGGGSIASAVGTAGLTVMLGTSAITGGAPQARLPMAVPARTVSTQALVPISDDAEAPKVERPVKREKVTTKVEGISETKSTGGSGDEPAAPPARSKADKNSDVAIKPEDDEERADEPAGKPDGDDDDETHEPETGASDATDDTDGTKGPTDDPTGGDTTDPQDEHGSVHSTKH